MKKYFKSILLIKLMLLGAICLHGQNEENSHHFGVLYGQNWLMNDTYKNSFGSYWTVGVDYNRDFENSRHWKFNTKLIYHRIEEKDGAGTPNAFNLLTLSPGIQFMFNDYVGLGFNIYFAGWRSNSCEINGVDCYKLRNRPTVSFPVLVWPEISIPIRIPLSQRLHLCLLPAYSTASFKEWNNDYEYMRLAVLLTRRF